MADYNLGRAHGQIAIDYDGSGVDKADASLQKVTKSLDDTDKSLGRTQKTLDETDRQFQSSGNAAQGFSARLREVRNATEEVDRSERDYKATLLDSRSTLRDIEIAHDRVTVAKRRHSDATHAARDAQAAWSESASAGERAARALGQVIPNLSNSISRLATTQEDAERKSSALARGLSGVAKVVSLLGPEARIAAGGFELASKGVDKFSSSASAGGGHIRNFIKDVAGFERAFGKISGLTLAVPSVGGLASIGGAAGLQGIVEMVEAVRQLSGALLLLPSAIAGVGFAAGTLKIAFHGVGDALKDMMSDDPKKFLEDIKNMGPAAAHSMLQIAQFRDMFKLAGGAIQDSFFKQVANDIAPLIQTWLPAIAAGMSKVSGIFGSAADQFAKLLMQPQMMQAFGAFITNISAGLQAMQPALKPLLDIFTQLTVVGSSFFGQIGGKITQLVTYIAGAVDKAAGSGALQQTIQTAIGAFEHLTNIVFEFGSAFNDIMNMADKFGGGGLLGFLDQIGNQLANWTKSDAGQKALTGFFTTLREATDAFLPILGPLLQGFTAITSAFTQLGIASAPAWVEFFKTFAYEMQNDLGPAIVAMGPAVGTFLGAMTTAFRQLIQTIGPQLPQIFQVLANAMEQLVPQLPQLAALFADLVQSVGPQLPKLFQSVTQALIDLAPLMPTIIGFIRDFVSIVTLLIQGGDKSEQALATLANGIIKVGGAVLDGLEGKLGKDLPQKAEEWGKSLVGGLIKGMLDVTGLTSLGHAAKSLVDGIADWFQHSPAKKGPFSGDGYTMVRGRKMVTDMAAGMAQGQPTIEAAARATAQAASGGLAGGTAGGGGSSAGGGAGAPAAGGAGTEGGSLLPDKIAHADTSVLDKYLSHEFPKNRGLAGLAADLGKLLSGFQNGFNLVMQHVLQPLGQVMGMIPALNQPTWKKMSPQAIAAQQQQEWQRQALENAKKQGPTWQDVFGNTPSVNPSAAAALPGDPALVAALQAKGFSPNLIRLIQGFSQVEGKNPAGNPTLGFTDSQLGGKSDLQSHVDALTKQILDRSSVAGLFPEKGTDLERAQWIAKVVGQAGLSSDWQGNAQPQDYVQRVLKAMPGPNGPTWDQVTGQNPPIPMAGLAVPTGAATPPITLPPGVKIGRDGSLSYPDGTVLPPGLPQRFPAGTTVGPGGAVVPPAGASTTPAGIAENPASAATRVPNAPNVEAGIRGMNLPTLYPTSGQGAYQVPAWANQLAAAFGLTASTYASGGSLHQMGYAFDFNGPQQNMDSFATFISQHLAQQTLQLIHASGNQRWGIASGQDVSGGGYYAGDYGGHFDHVHWATDVPVLINGQIPPGSMVAAGMTPGGTAPGTTQYPDVNNALGLIADNTGKSASLNDKLLSAYLQGNPDLAAQIDAAKTPGASDQQVQSTLNAIGTTISGLKSQDAIGNKNTIDALQSAQTQIAQQQGFQQGQSPAATFSGAVGSAGNAITSIIQTIQSGLDALTATQDLADRAVYGTRNTEDIMKQIDDVQKYITFAANVAASTGQILSTISGLVGAGGSADPSGGAQGAAAALGMAGQIAQLISGVLQGVNAAIDFGQQIWHIAGTYIGRGLSQLLAGVGGTPLMGDVRMELNKNTGQLIAYSADNPENKNYLNVPKGLNATYDYGSGQNPNPTVNVQNNVYGGPGQSAGELLNATAWMVSTSGTTGAMAAANF